MRIAVVGAGIGGLVVAGGLQHDGHDVTVYEQHQGPVPEGAGITLFGNAFEALDLMGLGDPVRGVSSGAIATMRPGQRAPSGTWLLTVPPSSVAILRSAHRAELHRTLVEQLTPGTVQAGTPAVVSADGSPTLKVGVRERTYDLVIAADGIRSRNRSALGLDTKLRYAGYTAWRGITEQPVDTHAEAGETWGRGRVFGIVPLPDNRVYWFATLTAPAGVNYPNEREVVLGQFSDWHRPIRDCIEATPADRVLRHDIFDLAMPLKRFHHGRTVLLGDAAHAMTPNLGQGAGQGIEDAATLVLLLRGANARNLEGRLERYSKLRTNRTKTVLMRSRMAGKIAQASNPAAVLLRNGAMRLTPGKAMGALSQGIQRWPIPL